MDLAVITVSYNTRELLADCLQSVLTGMEDSGLDGRVWVVDNASADGSAEMVRQRYPDVSLIAHDENLGFAAGNNLALQAMGFGNEAKPRHVLFLNPDTRVVGDALGALVRFLDRTETAGQPARVWFTAMAAFSTLPLPTRGWHRSSLTFFPFTTGCSIRG